MAQSIINPRPPFTVGGSRDTSRGRQGVGVAGGDGRCHWRVTGGVVGGVVGVVGRVMGEEAGDSDSCRAGK